MANELAFAPPRTEEMTAVAVGMGSAGVTGLAEGVIIKFAPGLGALEPVFTWGTLLGTPLMGAVGALFTRGMIADVFNGIAAGGSAILGYSLPALVAPFIPEGFEAKGNGARLLKSQQLMKELGTDPLHAPQRAQLMARVGLEF